MINVTDRIQENYRTLDRKEYEDVGTVSHDPAAAVTFMKLAAHRSNEIDKTSRGFDDIDEALNFQVLAACLSKFVAESGEHVWQTPIQPNPELRQIYALQLMNVLNKHQEACIKNGLWHMLYDPECDKFYARLTKRRRRSALLALDPIAQANLLAKVVDGAMPSAPAADDYVYFAFASAAEHLHFVTTSTPEAWSSFATTAGFTGHEITLYVGFLVFLSFAANEVGHSSFYSVDFLKRLRGIFVEAFHSDDFIDEVMVRLMNAFSLSPSKGGRLLFTPFRSFE